MLIYNIHLMKLTFAFRTSIRSRKKTKVSIFKQRFSLVSCGCLYFYSDLRHSTTTTWQDREICCFNLSSAAIKHSETSNSIIPCDKAL